MKARPTEYRGIRFKSKSEARFALFLDDQKKHWWYEPPALKLSDGYVPDFLIADVWQGNARDCGKDWRHPHLEIQIVEYKPSNPTATYMEELESRLTDVCSKFSGHPVLDFLCGSWHTLEAHIVTGGMGYQRSQYNTFCYFGPGEYDKNGWMYNCFQDGWPYELGGEHADAIMEKLKGYRFDLKENN